MTITEKIDQYLNEVEKPTKGANIVFKHGKDTLTGIATGSVVYGKYKIKAADGKEHSVSLNDIISVKNTEVTDSLNQKQNIYTVYWTEDRIDNNAILRAISINDAKEKAKKYIGKVNSVRLLSQEEVNNFDITLKDIKEMDKRGYFIYDSGT